MKYYEIIVVLAPGITQVEGGSLNFSQNSHSFYYQVEGDPQEFRFKAVKKLYQDKVCTNFILVGGTVDTRKEGERTKFLDNNGETIPKAEVMKYRLMEHYNIPEAALTTLKSSSNTEGNAIESLRYLGERNQQFIDQVGLLTNFYHLSRALRIFIDVANLRLVPVCAESIVYEKEFENVKQFYRSEGFSRILDDIKDRDSEIKGFLAREVGSYTPRNK